MTLGEVMTMTDEELRIKAAELMGFDLLTRTDFVEVAGMKLGKGTVWVGEAPPDYPNDIAAAWELRDAARAADGGGIARQYCMVDILFPEADPWEEQEGSRFEHDIARAFFGMDARAITRAFILAMSQAGE